MTRRIFQFMDANVSLDPEDGENTRWIAASEEAIAHEYARHNCMVPCAYNFPNTAEVFEVSYLEACGLGSDESYIKFGCDVVLP